MVQVGVFVVLGDAWAKGWRVGASIVKMKAVIDFMVK